MWHDERRLVQHVFPGFVEPGARQRGGKIFGCRDARILKRKTLPIARGLTTATLRRVPTESRLPRNSRVSRTVRPLCARLEIEPRIALVFFALNGHPPPLQDTGKGDAQQVANAPYAVAIAAAGSSRSQSS
jgi:hypothetical protein